MEPFGHIYMTVTPSRHVYVGQHRGATLGHYYGSGVTLMKSLKKYGRAAHSRAILARCYSQDELNGAEEEWIRFYANRCKAQGRRLLNRTMRGWGGPRWDAERRRKQTAISKRMMADPKRRALQSRVMSEVNKRHGADLAERRWTPEARQAHSEEMSRTKRLNTDEQRRKARENAIKRNKQPWSAERRQKRAERMRRVPRDHFKRMAARAAEAKRALQPHEPAQVLWLAGSGYSRGEIAGYFGVSVATVARAIRKERANG